MTVKSAVILENFLFLYIDKIIKFVYNSSMYINRGVICLYDYIRYDRRKI